MLSIRIAISDDAEAVHSVHMNSIRSVRLKSADSGRVDNWLKNKTVEEMVRQMETEQFIVAEEDGRIIGFAALDAGKSEITAVFVDPGYSRKGVGRALVGELEKLALLDGLVSARLMAAGSAIGFYQKLGYMKRRGSDREPSWAEMHKQLS